jgi:hypothetical protein
MSDKPDDKDGDNKKQSDKDRADRFVTPMHVVIEDDDDVKDEGTDKE